MYLRTTLEEKRNVEERVPKDLAASSSRAPTAPRCRRRAGPGLFYSQCLLTMLSDRAAALLGRFDTLLREQPFCQGINERTCEIDLVPQDTKVL